MFILAGVEQDIVVAGAASGDVIGEIFTGDIRNISRLRGVEQPWCTKQQQRQRHQWKHAQSSRADSAGFDRVNWWWW